MIDMFCDCRRVEKTENNMINNGRVYPVYICPNCKKYYITHGEIKVEVVFNTTDQKWGFDKEALNKLIENLWSDFGEVPMNPDTEEIESEWNNFPAGTHREEIWHWFEETFGVSVAEHLMGHGKMEVYGGDNADEVVWQGYVTDIEEVMVILKKRKEG